ncbi:MAG TPA: PilN domain-containing protein [Terriglobia bacterium]|nr:PilN domain-containing protein [Terriglobia bacterium]
MIFSKTSVGFEVGDKDLCLAVMRSNLGKVQLDGVHRIAGFIEMNDEERKKAIRTLVKSVRVPTTRVYLSVPRTQGIVRQINLPGDLGQKVADVMKLQVETLSPWPLEEIYWDFVTEPPKKNRKLSTTTIAIIPKTALDPWIAFFKAVGIPLSGATLSSLAYGHGASVLWGGVVPTVILHLQQSCTEGVVVNGSFLAAMTAPSTEGTIAPKAFVDRLLSVAKLPSGDGSRLLVCGRDLDPSFTEENPHLPLENAKLEASGDFGALATALLPLKESAFKSNLVPPQLRYRESQLRLIPTFILGFVSLCVCAALFVREPYQNTVYASRLDVEIQKIAPQVKEVANQEAELNALSGRYRALAAHLQNHDYNLEALRELARVLPPTAFISNYSYQDGTMTISGIAPSASEIQNLLENSPILKGVEFTTSVTRDDSGKDRFTLKMAVGVAQ